MEYETKEILIEDVEENIPSSRPETKGNFWMLYLNIFKRKWFIIVACLIAGFVPTYLWSLRDPKFFGGTFEMLVEPISNEEQLTDPSVLARVGTEASANVFGLDYPTILKVLDGRTIREKVATQINQKFPNYTKDYLMHTFNKYLVVERAKQSRSRLDITKIIFVRYQSGDPRITLAVLRAFADEFLKYSQQEREKNLQSGVNFIDQQLPVIKSRIDQLQDKQKEIQSEYELIQPQTKGDTLFQINTASQQEIRALEAQIKELTVLSNNLQNDLGLSPQEALIATTLSQDPERQNLLVQLQQIESEIALQSAVLTPSHPSILNLREQKNNINRLIESENRRILRENNISTSINPRVFVNQDANRQGLINTLTQTQNELDTLSSRYQSITQNQRQTASDLATIPDVIKQYNDLERQIQLDTNILNQLTSQKEALSVDFAQKQAPWEILAEPKIPVDRYGRLVSSNSDPTKKWAAGLGLGLMVGMIATIAIEKRRDIYYEPSDIEYAFGLPVLGTLPMGEKIKQLETLENGNFFDESDTVRAFQESSDSQSSLSAIYTNIYFKLSHLNETKDVLISSLNPADGQAYLCANLAKTAADIDQKVLLVDGNVFEDEISVYFDDSVRRGIRELIQATVMKDSEIRKLSNRSNISILTTGRANADLPLNIGAEETQSVIKSIAREYSLTLYNTSFFLESHDLSLLADKTQGIVMAVRLKQTSQASLRKAVERIKKFNLNFLGFVVIT